METAEETRRKDMVSSWAALAVALGGAVLMALAFPKTNVATFAPLGAAALYWAWFGLSPKRAFLVGWAAGSVFFAINFAWFGETAGALIAPFGEFLTLGPGIGDAFFGFALPALGIAHLQRRAPGPLVPLAGAGIFAFAEWFRCEGLGVLGVPFGSIGYSQVDSPLAPLGAYIGTYGITFAIALLAAYAAYAVRASFRLVALRHAGIAYGAVVAGVALAWLAWPAKTLAPPTFRVAAIQGNIPQSVKARPEAFAPTLARYTALTLGLRKARVKLVLWPETVIVRALNLDPDLRARFGALAKFVGAELVVGTFEVFKPRKEYNVLFFFRPDGKVDGVYQKRQLVPFAEHLPLRRYLEWIPWAKEVNDIGTGDSPGVVDVEGMRIAPIVCWESAFSGLNVDDVRHGAQALAIATDDAWFGTTAGPYMHAQIARMRAIETGRWIVRAAATGISGIVAPNGRYVEQSKLEVSTVVIGEIGAPVATTYDAIGPLPVALVCLALFGGILAWPARRRVRR